MINRFVLCVAVITLINDSANGKETDWEYKKNQVLSLSIELNVQSRSSTTCWCIKEIYTFFRLTTSSFFIVPLISSKIIILGLIKRCYQCRSRGELGSCKDPFRYNASHIETEPGVTAIPCASGWCGKVIEGETGAFREDGELFFSWLGMILMTLTIF